MIVENGGQKHWAFLQGTILHSKTASQSRWTPHVSDHQPHLLIPQSCHLQVLAPCLLGGWGWM